MNTLSLNECVCPGPADPTWAQQQAQFLDAALERRVRENTIVLQAAFEREHRRAEMFQRSLLMPSAHLHWPGLHVAACSEVAVPAALIGGDFYDCFPLNETQIGLTLGDICGKGLVAAVHIPAVKFALRGFLSEHGCPARAMTCLNELLCRNADAFGEPLWPVALSLVVLDRQTGEISCTVAGTEAPLLLRSEGSWEQVPAAGMLLGVEASAEYEAALRKLNPADVLLMVTDGISESRQGRQMFGDAALHKAAASTMAMLNWSQRSADIVWEVGNAVLIAARDFCGGVFHDDACVLTAQLCSA